MRTDVRGEGMEWVRVKGVARMRRVRRVRR
jgi:hypothetical protein